jgi:DoxX-like protein
MRFNKALWVVQGVLALLFVFSGGMKLSLPLETFNGPIHLPGWFLRFIGTAELLGGFGLVLPGAFRIHTELMPIAAAGLVIIMIGATVLSFATMGVAAAIVPLAVGTLAGCVAYARSPLARTASSF